MDGNQAIMPTKSRLVGPNFERVVVQTSRRTVKEMTARIGQAEDAACTECLRGRPEDVRTTIQSNVEGKGRADE